MGTMKSAFTPIYTDARAVLLFKARCAKRRLSSKMDDATLKKDSPRNTQKTRKGTGLIHTGGAAGNSPPTGKCRESRRRTSTSGPTGYLERSVWLRIRKPSPAKTDQPHSR